MQDRTKQTMGEVMRFLRKHPGKSFTVREVAVNICRGKSRVAEIMPALEAKELVERVGQRGGFKLKTGHKTGHTTGPETGHTSGNRMETGQRKPDIPPSKNGTGGAVNVDLANKTGHRASLISCETTKQTTNTTTNKGPETGHKTGHKTGHSDRVEGVRRALVAAGISPGAKMDSLVADEHVDATIVGKLSARLSDGILINAIEREAAGRALQSMNHGERMEKIAEERAQREFERKIERWRVATCRAHLRTLGGAKVRRELRRLIDSLPEGTIRDWYRRTKLRHTAQRLAEQTGFRVPNMPDDWPEDESPLDERMIQRAMPKREFQGRLM